MTSWSQPLGESWRAWVALAIGVLAVSAHSALSFGMSPLLKPITDELGWTRTQYAGAMNFRILLLTLTVPFAGQLVDRFGARMVLAAGALLMGLGTLGLANASTLSELYLLSVVVGPGQAFIGSVVSSALVLRLFRRHRGIALGILNGGDNLITSMVHVAAASLLVSVGWRGALGSLAGGYIVLALLIAVALRPGEGMSAPDLRRDAARAEKESGRAGIPWGDPRLWLIFACYAAIYAFVTSIGLHFPAFLRDLGRDPEQAARIYGLSTLVGAFGSVACGWLCERTSARTALSIVMVGLLATSLVLWMPAASDTVFFTWAVAYGVVNAGVVALLALVLDEVFGDARIGRLMGVAMMGCMAATIAGNFFSAATHDATGSYLSAWRVYTVLLALALVPVEILRRWPAARAPAPTGAELQRGT